MNGWMNDPNGLIRLDSVWHMFFQHHPDGIDHDDIHWGHAVSHDLLSWEERPIALAPDQMGTCFSGSAVETPDGDVKIFYTAHSLTPEGRDHQVQCLVHADRSLTKSARDYRNPILPNPGREAFRDPKVIWHEQTSRWIMLVTLGQEIGIYSSTDLVDWRFESRFGEADISYRGGVWECPDLLRFDDGDGGEVWVLIVGVQSGAANGGSGTMYFIGDFDGQRFENHGDPDQMLWMDRGRDFYAAQGFFDRAGGEPVVMAWISNWDYARETPTKAFRGVMSLPRILSLVNTPKGRRLRQNLPEQVLNKLKSSSVSSGTYGFAKTFEMVEGDRTAILLFGSETPQFVLSRKAAATGVIHCHRDEHPDMQNFGHDLSIEFDWPMEETLELQFYVDRGVVELSAMDGTLWVTNLFYPEDPGGEVRILPNKNTTTQLKEIVHG
ncbi:glycoside hydrolase family 32 protein [Actibacterium pelagium]|nr:glycoside hydrolase family 32 protein [Actibacterium pelagium]